MRKCSFVIILFFSFLSCSKPKTPCSAAEKKPAAPLKVSVTCPTYCRADRHNLLYMAFCHQTYPNKELIVYDDSPSPSPFFQSLKDERVRYIYTPGKKSIGAKRNILVQMAEGEIIAHFDDDDFYAPIYLEKMVDRLGEGDLVKLSKWMAWREIDGTLWEWDTSLISEAHYNVSAWDEQVVRFDLAKLVPEPKEFNDANVWGYGFTFVYKRSLGQQFPFEDINGGEDGAFAKKAISMGKNVRHFPDEDHIVLHIIHRGNVSKIFPQYAYDRLSGIALLGDEAAFWLMIR